MKKKIKYILLFVFVVVLTVGGIKAYQMYLLMGRGQLYLDGESAAMPAAQKNPPPLNTGKSDWPRWRGDEYSGKSTLSGLKTDWEKGLSKLWEVEYLCQGDESASWSAPVIQGNRLLISGRDEQNDILFCLHAETGELLWKSAIETSSDAKFGTGPRATPCIDGEMAYSFGRSGILACWQLFDGKLIWKNNVMDAGGTHPEWGHSSSPLVFGNKIIVQGGGEARLIAYDKTSGEILWKTSGGEAGYAAVIPAFIQNDTLLLQFHGTGLAGIDPATGEEYWSAPWETSYYVNACTPIVKGDTVFITSAYKMGAQALKFSKEGYSIVWQNDVIASQLSDQVLVDGYLYGYTGNGNNSGPFKCVDFSTGEEQWKTRKIGGGSITWVDNYLVAFGVKGDLYLVEPNPERFILAGELEEAIPEVAQAAWTPPVVANGKIYLRYMHKLVCYSVMP